MPACEGLPLPGMSAGALADVVDDFRAGYAAYLPSQADSEASRARCEAAWNACLDQTTQWLWDEVMAPVVIELAGRPGAVLVPGGLLGLLPLHAAWRPDRLAPTGRRYLLDDLTVRYIPNARALTAARALAAAPAEPLIAVTDPPRTQRLRRLTKAQVETAAAVAGFAGSAEPVTGAGATADAVRRALSGAGAAHFACHGLAELNSPLDSRLLAAGDDDLRLRDLLAM